MITQFWPGWVFAVAWGFPLPVVSGGCSPAALCELLPAATSLVAEPRL